MVGASEDGGAAFVVTAHLHAAVAAGIEEDMDLARPVAAQDHRLLTHRGYEEIAGVRDLALMPDKEPAPGEHPLQLLAVDLVIDKDLSADLARREIHEIFAVPFLSSRCHRRSPRFCRGWGLPIDMPSDPRPAHAARSRPSPRESARRSESLPAPSPEPVPGSAHRERGVPNGRA